MADFRSPKHSKIRPGNFYPAAAGAQQVKAFRVYRYDPDSGANPRVDTHQVELESCAPLVLDALIKTKNETDWAPTFKRYCPKGLNPAKAIGEIKPMMIARRQ